MSVKERILAIRIMEKLQSRPDFAKALGVEVRGEMAPRVLQIRRRSENGYGIWI